MSIGDFYSVSTKSPQDERLMDALQKKDPCKNSVPTNAEN